MIAAATMGAKRRFDPFSGGIGTVTLALWIGGIVSACTAGGGHAEASGGGGHGFITGIVVFEGIWLVLIRVYGQIIGEKSPSLAKEAPKQSESA